MRAPFDIYSQPITNLFRNHSPTSSWDGWFNGGTIQGVAGNVTRSVATDLPFTNPRGFRGTITAAGTTAGTGAFCYTDGSMNPKVEVGKAYTVSAYFRCTRAVVLYPRFYRFTAAAAVQGVDDGAPVSVPANTWTRISYTSAVMPIGADNIRFDLNPHSTCALLQVGDVYEVTAAMCTEGTTLWPFSESGFPGWTSIGAVSNGVQASVGYPYTLESIAGPPDAQVIGVGSVTGPSPANALTSGRTFISMVDITDLASASYVQYATYGQETTTGGARFAHRCKAAGDGNMEAFFQFPGGAQNNGVQYNGVRTLGRHILASRWTTAVNAIQIRADSAVTIGASANLSTVGGVGTGWSSGVLATYSNSLGTPVIALGYARDIGDDAMRRVMAWLARTYRATVPTGY